MIPESKQNNESAELAHKFRKYNNLQWQNWIDNIIIYNYAPEITQFESDTDVLRDIMLFLHRNDVDTIVYEGAIASCINKYKEDFVPRVFRLIDALRYIKDPNTYKLLYELFSNIKMAAVEFEGNKLATKILQNISFRLPTEIPSAYQNGFTHVGGNYFDNDFANDPGYCQNYITFVREQFGVEKAYGLIIKLAMTEDQRMNKSDLLIQQFSTVVKFKVREFYKFNEVDFFEKAYVYMRKYINISASKILFKTFFDSWIEISVNVIETNRSIREVELNYLKKKLVLLCLKRFELYNYMNNIDQKITDSLFIDNDTMNNYLVNNSHYQAYIKPLEGENTEQNSGKVLYDFLASRYSQQTMIKKTSKVSKSNWKNLLKSVESQ